MKYKKGYTLIEVVLSIVILSIISIVFLNAIVTNFSFLKKSKKLSQNNFLEQGIMEKEINKVKEDLEDGNLKEIKIFKDSMNGIGMNVKYKEVLVTDNDFFYYTYVPRFNTKELILLELDSISNTVLYKNSFDDLSFGYNTNNFKIKGRFSNDQSTKDYVYLNTIEWYKSVPKFINPLSKSIKDSPLIEDDESLNYYPVWPTDYSLIKEDIIRGAKFNYNVELNNIYDHKGSNIIFAVTPAAKSGKIGTTKISNPVFISGLPVTDNLVLHLDAGFIGTLEDGEIDIDNKIIKWFDLSNRVYDNDLLYASVNSQSAPILMNTDIDNEFIGQYVKFEETQSLNINKNISEDNLYVYAVIKPENPDEQSIFFTNGDSSISIVEKSIQNEWLLSKYGFKSNGNIFQLGNSNIDIAEIVMYDKELSEDQILNLTNYFTNKYSKLIVRGDIEYIPNVKKIIDKGDIFELPSTILANMIDDYQKHVYVEWDKKDYDVNNPGSYILEGHAVIDKTKKFNYTLVVNNK